MQVFICGYHVAPSTLMPKCMHEGTQRTEFQKPCHMPHDVPSGKVP